MYARWAATPHSLPRPAPHEFAQLGTQLILANANRTAALVPPHTYVPWVVVNGQPIGEDPNSNLLSSICDAYTAAGGANAPAACATAASAQQQLLRGKKAPSVCRVEV
jgi:interferon gamma-inducible protein 30